MLTISKKSACDILYKSTNIPLCRKAFVECCEMAILSFFLPYCVKQMGDGDNELIHITFDRKFDISFTVCEFMQALSISFFFMSIMQLKSAIDDSMVVNPNDVDAIQDMKLIVGNVDATDW